MKHVVKGPSPEGFEAWKASGNSSWQPTYAVLQNPEKKLLHETLLKEQRWVCCYCGRGISLQDSHIEHFRPQESHPALALDFRNLFASCIRERNPGAPLHCGHAKGNTFDEANHIDPLDPACEQRFLYALDGAILPADDADAAARYMRDILKLDLPFLRNRRLDVLERVFDVEFLETASDAELQALIRAFRSADEQGQLESFGHVVARYAEQLQSVPT
jgi:uncharacterized protein (TIGR02646 family)